MSEVLEGQLVDFDFDEMWERVSEELKKLVSSDTYQRFFDGIRPLRFEGNVLTLLVENSIYKYFILDNYMSQMEQAATLVIGKDVKIDFECEDNDKAAVPAGKKEAVKAVQGKAGATAQRVELIDRYRFETFIVGSHNEFAHAAAKSVAEDPEPRYNPLFIHGKTGLGKTHLMHAIGHRIIQKKKTARVVYVTSEQFANEFISAIQNGQLVQFRNRFRKADALLIDDVHFFGKKDRTQEEFFHTFNALYDGHKKIILSSDMPPGEVPNLEHRMVSRFEWGLAAEIQSPDIETRLAILKAKAEKMEVKLGDGILMFIAERVKSNIRRLEGALNRVAAWAVLNHRRITQDQVENLLMDFVSQEKPVITSEKVMRTVADTFDIRMTDMTSKRRPSNIAIPRMVAMYLTRKHTNKSLVEIGESFGGRDHGTVLHAVKTVEEKLLKDDNTALLISQCEKKLGITA